MNRQHTYNTTVTWTGNRGEGTTTYRGYGREHDLSCDGKSTAIPGSSDPNFLGDPTRWTPEDLLVGSLSQCHMLWFLHLCTTKKIVVTAYVDRATGLLQEHADGSGEFLEVVLHPEVTMTDPSRAGELDELHHRAHDLCFIARSVNFPVKVEGTVTG
jgi:organic hydroperoxide reductase OsmC/OhrA